MMGSLPNKRTDSIINIVANLLLLFRLADEWLI